MRLLTTINDMLFPPHTPPLHPHIHCCMFPALKDILIACVDGLKGFLEAIKAAFPQTQVQLCIVHLVRHSLNFVSWKQRKKMADNLKEIYNAPTVEQAEANL